jgi:hypothetical protein
MDMRRSLPLLAVGILPALLWGCGTDVDGPVAPLLTCVYGDITTLAPSEVWQVQGPDSRALCVGPEGAATGEFLFIPFYGAEPSGSDGGDLLPLTVALTSVRPQPDAVDGPSNALVAPDPSAGVRPGPAGGDPAFHDRLRRREIEELTPLIRSGASSKEERAAALRAPAADVPAQGDLLELNVALSCTESELRTGRVERVSEHAILVEDTTNPTALTSFDRHVIAMAYDTLIYPLSVAHFGEPGDIDGNARTILFFTGAVNEFTPAGSSALTLGFFWSGDLFPAEATARLEGCPEANGAEMMYLIAPDPLGRVGPLISADRIRELVLPLIGHELQHLINASRRLYVNDAGSFEEPWLNEGLSHIAEELLFYRVAGLTPRSNLSAADIEVSSTVRGILDRYMWGNLWNLHRYLSRPDTASLMTRDLLTTRGATWSFLRYAVDRSEREDAAFFHDVVNGRTGGLENLNRVLDGGALQWMQDWTVALYADDLLTDMGSRYSQPSWDFRSLFPAMGFGHYPLRILPLVAADPVDVRLRPGGTVYTTFGVGAGEQAVLHVEAEGETRASAIRGSLVRIR